MWNEREHPTTTQLADAPESAPTDSSRPPELVIREAPGPDVARRSQGLKDFCSGAILISIGFAFGGSVFLGNPGPLDWVFDTLGAAWIAKGLWGLWNS